MKTLFFSIAFFASLSFSCKKESEPAPELSCDKGVRIISQQLGTIPVSIQYDSKGRISKVFRSDGQGLIENYQYTSDTTLTVTRNSKDGGVTNTYKAILNKKGYVTSYSMLGSFAYTSTYRYDDNGFLTEQTTKFETPKQTIRSVYAYQNGSRVSEISHTDGVQSYSDEYKYSENAGQADLIFNSNQPDLYGRYSARLPEAINRKYKDGKTESYTFTYQLNKKGLVESLKQVYTDTDKKSTEQVNLYKYECK